MKSVMLVLSTFINGLIDFLDCLKWLFSLFQEIFDDLKERLASVGPTKLQYVCREKKKPKVLRLYEPVIEEE